MSNEHEMGWLEIGLTIISGVAILLSSLTRLAWDTKPTTEKVALMIKIVRDEMDKEHEKARQEIMRQISEKITDSQRLNDEKLSGLSKLFESRIEDIRRGMDYSNRGMDELKRLITDKRGR